MEIKWNLFVEYPHEFVYKEIRGVALFNLFNKPLVKFEGTPTISKYLLQENIGVSVATSTLDDYTAVALKQLGQPVTLWIVVDDQHGYWANRTSAPFVVDRLREVDLWVKKHGLMVRRIGFDFEISIQLLRSLNFGMYGQFLSHYFWYLKNRKSNAAEIVQNALEETGYEAEYYVFPSPLDRVAGGGLRPPQGSRQITMMYTSMLPRWLRPLFLGLHKKTQIPAFGIANGKKGQTPGRDLGPSLPRHLTAQELAEDVGKLNPEKEAYLFALNGPDVIYLLEKSQEILKTM